MNVILFKISGPPKIGVAGIPSLEIVSLSWSTELVNVNSLREFIINVLVDDAWQSVN